MRVTLGGARIDLLPLEEIEQRVLRALGPSQQGPPLLLTLADLDHLYHFGIDSGREAMFSPRRQEADWLVLPSSTLLTWMARRLTGARWDAVTTSELLPQLLRTAQRSRARVGFLGGNDRQRDALATVITSHFPDLEHVGHWIPGRSQMDDDESSRRVADDIGRADVDLLVVGLGKPRQEEWLLRCGTRSGARVVVGHGSADFLCDGESGTSDKLRRVGVAATTRLTRDPIRSARRILIQRPSALVRLFGQSRTDEAAGATTTARAGPILATPRLWRRRIGRALALADGITIAASSGAAYWLRDLLGQTGIVRAFADEVPVALGVIPLWLLIFHYVGAYRPEILNTGGDAFRRFVSGAVGGLFALGFVSFLLNLELSRLYVFMLFGLVLITGGLTRVNLRRYLRSRRARGRLRQNVLIVGADADAVAAATALANDEMAGYTPIGFLCDGTPFGTEPIAGIPVLGRPDDVLDLAYDRRAGLVIVSPTGVSPGTLQELTIALEGTPVDLAIAPSLFQVMARRMTVESVANVPILHVDQIRLDRGKAALKRLVDVVVAGSLMVLTLPVVLVSMLAVRLDSPGPIIFVQRRVGREGRPINVLKLRTMVEGAEAMQPALHDVNDATGHFFKMRVDPRVTRVGRVLRRLSIDELPQLHNVLRGDMSMVGPRPPTPDEVAKYDSWHLRRLRVRPGITGVWQTSGRSEVGFDEAVKLDLFYIENWSLGYDLFLLSKTVLAVLSGRGAY